MASRRANVVRCSRSLWLPSCLPTFHARLTYPISLPEFVPDAEDRKRFGVVASVLPDAAEDVAVFQCRRGCSAVQPSVRTVTISDD